MADPMANIEFRDGERLVPAHVAVLMKGIETHTMTYDQAIRIANTRLITDRLGAAQRGLIADHFKQTR